MLTLLLCCLIAFCAGFVDAIAGGGGLIQIPGLMMLFPQLPIVTVLGTNKLAAGCGTLMASYHYVRHFHIKIFTIAPALIAAAIFSALGAFAVTQLNNQILKPIIIVLLIVISFYTIFKKNLGAHSNKRYSDNTLVVAMTGVAAVLGFYDGFFGPGTGSILLFLLVGWLGFSFLEGSAFTKLINLATNVAAIIIFAVTDHIFYQIAVPMAICNILGNLMGAKLAIKKGSRFVRWFFLLVLLALIVAMLRQY